MLSYKNNSRHLDVLVHKMYNAKGLVAVLIATGLAVYAFSIIGYLHLADAVITTKQSTPPSIPQAFMTYNGHKYSMSPFVFAERGNLTKIQSPLLPDTVTPELTLQEGSTISFDFASVGGGGGGTKTVPNQVYVYVVDYEGDVNSLFALKKVGQDTFELSGTSGIKTLELHVLLPDNNNNKYISFTKLVDIHGNNNNSIANGINPNQNKNSPNIEANNNVNNNNNGNINAENSFNPNSAQSCGSSSELNLAQITSSSSNAASTRSSNIPTSTPLTWSATGEGSWIQLDLGQPKSICSIEIAFANGDNSINFFNIQTSTDGVHFLDHGPFQNTGHVSGLEQYSLDTPVTARFVKLMFQGSIQANSYNISDMKVLGNS
ncbi:MAG: discoidin domain-containing protein [Thermoproteota archaeon]|nr:discoidin domain-containing protein [Thermoproteota archaeon]